MKKYLFALVALLALTTQGHAQKFLDIYRNGNIVSSVKAADVDSLAVGHDNGQHTLYFWQQGKMFHYSTIANVDSVKVFRTEDEPLVYLGVVGFNQELYEKPFSYLDKNTAANFKSFVGNLQRKDGTLLYYGVDHALDMLQSTSFPTPVSSVNLITFTDGLDQGSLMMGSDYNTDEQYLNAVSSRIGSMTVKGLSLTAYSLGLRGSDVSNYSLFQRNLNKLASSSDKAFEVTSMSAVRTRLQEISDQIISISNKQTISMKIPGQSDGTVIRFTFDNASAANSTLYIEGTFQLSDRSLRNVTYHGLKAESGSVVQGRQNGIFVTYTFNGLQRADGYGLVPTNNICQYYRSANAPTWQVNSEFTPANNTQAIITHSGAIILLALDCSSSLGSQFSDMQSYAKDFIDRIANNTTIHVVRPFGNTSTLVTSLTLNKSTLTLYEGTTSQLSVMVKPAKASYPLVTWESSNKDVATVDQNGLVTAIVAGISDITAKAADGSGVETTCSVAVCNDQSSILKRDYVDLGLPSGTLWATCNIGASRPEDYGLHFFWGDPVGYSSEDIMFNGSTYKWCMGSSDTLTKYCT